MSFFLAICMFWAALPALARPLVPHRDITKSINFKHSQQQHDFEGIITFSNCSGALVAFKGAAPEDKAIAMTNAHCLDFARHDQVYVNHPYQRIFSVFDKNKRLHRLKTDKVLYATMFDTDVAWLETNKTYAEIAREYNVRPLIIDDVPAGTGTELNVVSGYWEEVTSCSLEAIIPQLREFHWWWRNSLRYSVECRTRGGFSGSPVVMKNTRLVIGIHNTGNNGKRDCSDSNPCEVGNEQQMPLYRRYAQPIHQAYTCLNQRSELDLSLSACQLPKP